MGMQSVLRAIYPPQCLACGARVTSDFALCGPCWRDAAFITGLVCDKCGCPLPGTEGAGPEFCDDCLTIARPWERGRAALLYRDTGRRLVLALKHGDRLDIAKPAAKWMAQAVGPILLPDMVVAPIPLHWQRLLRRRYNQAALLSVNVARTLGLPHFPDLLRRARRTPSQDGRDRDGRFANVAGALVVSPDRARRIAGRAVLLVDDVMTSGATFAAATEACRAAGAERVFILSLARVAKDA